MQTSFAATEGRDPDAAAAEPSADLVTALSPFVCQFLRHLDQLSAEFTREGEKGA
jgi:hypothetical protein